MSSIDVYVIVCESIDVVSNASHCACCGSRPFATRSADSSSGVYPEQSETSSSGAVMARRVQRRILIPHFRGAVRINSLEVYPLQYHPDPVKLEASLFARGRKWLVLQGILYVRYAGPATFCLSVDGCRTAVKYDVDSYVLLDRASFMRLHPDYDVGGSGHVAENVIHTMSSILDDLRLAPPVLYGFSVSDRKWLTFTVEHVQSLSCSIDGLPNPLGSISATHDTGKSEILPTTRCSIVESPSGVITAKSPGERISISHKSDARASAESQRFCREELATLVADLESRYVHIVSELDAKYAAQQRAVLVLAALGALSGAALLSLIYRLLGPAAARTARWSGPTHFTIPILSPFSSVVEHESSLLSIGQAAGVLIAAVLCYVLWVRCTVRRK
ncbi:hypothetical protein C2E23DRAFT_466566 [Lenzites betulinus]|nr:hypothetical protein C2E23DRAFT_466566 [Lenzites betulinus]